MKEILSFTLFKIVTVSRSSTLFRVFLMARWGVPTKKNIFFGGGGGGGGSLLASQKVWTFPFYWISPPTPIFSNTIMTYFKKLIGTKFINIKHCPAGLSPKIMPPCPPKHSLETLEMGENPTQEPKICPAWNISLMKFTSSTIESVIPSPSNYPIQASFVVVAMALHRFLTSGFMYTCVVLMLINQCLLNVVFSMIKVLNR